MERLPRTWIFVYDPFDRLIKRSVDPDGAGPQAATVAWTAYDGVHAYADFNGSGTLTNRYLYGPAIDMILARVDSSGSITWHLRRKSVRESLMRADICLLWEDRTPFPTDR